MNYICSFFLIFFLLNNQAFSIQTVPCEKTDEIGFSWDWCNKNLSKDKTIIQVCSGHVYFQDMIFNSVLIEMNDQKKECLFDNSDWKEIKLSTCYRAIRRDYAHIYGPLRKTKIDECYNKDGRKISVEGKLSTGQKFKARRK